MNPKELTLRGLILGSLLTLVFTAANVYLGLKVGLRTSPLHLGSAISAHPRADDLKNSSNHASTTSARST